MSSIYSSEQKKEFKEQFFSHVEKSSHVVITSHVSPDDDSIGSVLSMYALLSGKYPEKNVQILYTGTAVDRYNVFPGFEHITWVTDVADHLEGVDLLVTLDASNWRRFTKKEEILAAVATRIGIDHHASVPDEYTLLLKDETACANTELMYSIFFEGEKLSKEVASYLLLGINGDTGGLSYVPPSKKALFSLVGELVETVGESIDLFRSRYMGIPVAIIPLLQQLVANAAYEQVPGWPPVQYSYIASAEGYSDEDMSAASHIYMGQYLTRVLGYSWGFVITPRSDGGCRVSARSLTGSVDVRAFNEGLGIGSGHIRAAGGSFKNTSAVECVEEIKTWMQSHTPTLD